LNSPPRAPTLRASRARFWPSMRALSLLPIRPKCDGHHRCLAVPLLHPPQHMDLAPGGRHGTETGQARIRLRDGSRDGGDHPGDHDVGGSSESRQRFGCADFAEANDLPARTLEFVLRGSQASVRGMNAGWVEPTRCHDPTAVYLRAIPTSIARCDTRAAASSP